MAISTYFLLSIENEIVWLKICTLCFVGRYVYLGDFWVPLQALDLCQNKPPWPKRCTWHSHTALTKSNITNFIEFWCVFQLVCFCLFNGAIWTNQRIDWIHSTLHLLLKAPKKIHFPACNCQPFLRQLWEKKAKRLDVKTWKIKWIVPWQRCNMVTNFTHTSHDLCSLLSSTSEPKPR